MSGEEIRQNKENQQPLDEGMQSLADMPTFEQKISRETQDKSYEEARRDGTLPEGVRDEQDYQEYLLERNIRAAEAIERDRAIAGEIERIENPYDKNLVLSIIPRFYDENGDRVVQKENKYFDGLSLAIEYANRGDKDTSIEEFAEHKLSQRKHEMKNKGIDYYRNQEASEELYWLRDTLDVLKRASYYSNIQKETDDNRQSILKIKQYFENDKSLKYTDFIPEVLEDFNQSVSENFDFLSTDVRERYRRHSAGERVKRPVYDKGIATVITKRILQEHLSADPESKKRELRQELNSLASYCEGYGFSRQMEQAIDYLKENYYDRAIEEMSRNGEILFAYKEQRRITAGNLADIMAIYTVSGDFHHDRVFYADYLDNIEDGKKILAKL